MRYRTFSRHRHGYNNPVMNRLLKLLIASLGLVMFLAACTVTTRVDGNLHGRVRIETPVRADSVITQFRPTRGHGSIYRVGEDISFVLRSNRSGFVTLSYLDSSGRVAVFARNIRVNPSRNVITGPDPSHVFTVAEPRGFMQIRASFTAQPTNEAVVRYQGQRGQSGWNSVLTLDVSGQPAYDAVQTYIEVR